MIMHRLAFTFLLCFAACGSLLVVEAIPAPDEQKTATTIAAQVEGWSMDRAAWSLVGEKLPSFSVKQNDGKTLTSESLRNRWTILGVWTTGAPPADEPRYA